MQIECYETLNDTQAAEWVKFLVSATHAHPRQNPRFAEVERALGRKVLFTIGRQGGNICAVGLWSLRQSRFLPHRFSEAMALSGPVCDDSTLLVAFLNSVSDCPEFKQVDALNITPYWVADDAQALSDTFSQTLLRLSDPEPFRHTGLIDLDRPESDIRASFSKSARRKIRLAENKPIEIRHVTSWLDAEVFFNRLNTLVLQRHSLTPVTEAEQRAQFQAVLSNPKIGALFCAYYEGIFLGGLLLYRSTYTAHARRYVADPDAAKKASNLRVAPLVWLHGMLWAKEQGSRWFDVEGFRLITDKSEPLFKVYEYKRELSPEPVLRVGEHTLPLHKGYDRINRLPAAARRKVKQAVHMLKRRAG